MDFLYTWSEDRFTGFSKKVATFYILGESRRKSTTVCVTFYRLQIKLQHYHELLQVTDTAKEKQYIYCIHVYHTNGGTGVTFVWVGNSGWIQGTTNSDAL